MFQANGSVFEKATQGIPDEKWLFQPSADSNHMMFSAGHVVVHRAFVSKYLGVEWSAPWSSVFSRGAKRVPPEQYPSVGEIRKACKEVSEKLMAALPNATPELLAQPLPKERPSLDGTLLEEPSACSASTRLTMLVRWAISGSGSDLVNRLDKSEREYAERICCS